MSRKYFFFSSRRRHTRCALVTGVQTCALPISLTAAERGGIQPVVSVTAGGSARLEAKVGEMVELEVRTEVPPGAGTIIAVEWDFDGQGKYPFGHEVSGKDSALTLSTSHEFDQPGTYFPTARVVSHREGDLDAKLRRIENLASARVIVR